MAGDQDGNPHPDGRQCGAAEARAQLLRQRPLLRGASWAAALGLGRGPKLVKTCGFQWVFTAKSVADGGSSPLFRDSWLCIEIETDLRCYEMAS